MTTAETQVCIVGAGPAGATVAAELAERGVAVTVLESGPRYGPDELLAAQRRLLRGDVPFPSVDPGLDGCAVSSDVGYEPERKRMRGVGGASLHWEGYAMRFHPADFVLRSAYGLAADWPLGYGDLEPYYLRVERELGVAGGDDDDCPRSASFPLPAFPFSYSDGLFARGCAAAGVRMQALPQARNPVPYAGRPACRSCGTCHVCPIGAKATVDLTHLSRAEASGRVAIRERAHVVALEHDGRGRVRAARYRDPSGEHRLDAGCFVLAAGALENVRLCLLSGGLATGSGLLGACFMSQPVVDFTARVGEPLYPYRTGISTAIARQFEDPPDRADAGSFWMEFRNRAGPTPAEIARESRSWGPALRAEVRRRFDGQAAIRVWVEQLPDPTNRVTLDRSRRDTHGSPIPHLRYHVGPRERVTIERADAVVRRIFAAMCARDVRRSPIMHGGIMTGTHRLGIDPAASVVDPAQRAHDVPNLFLVGGGGFVTAGAAPPTLTLMALALRSAESIAAGLR